MIAWEPRINPEGPWHLTDRRAANTSICGIQVKGYRGYSQRNPHKIDDYGGQRCPTCWNEWQLRTAASYARQEQDEAAKTKR